jgi:hypothetical protein
MHPYQVLRLYKTRPLTDPSLDEAFLEQLAMAVPLYLVVSLFTWGSPYFFAKGKI